jgi:hypothetical protein
MNDDAAKRTYGTVHTNRKNRDERVARIVWHGICPWDGKRINRLWR